MLTLAVDGGHDNDRAGVVERRKKLLQHASGSGFGVGGLGSNVHIVNSNIAG
jgi:hypothetical protein